MERFAHMKYMHARTSFSLTKSQNPPIMERYWRACCSGPASWNVYFFARAMTETASSPSEAAPLSLSWRNRHPSSRCSRPRTAQHSSCHRRPTGSRCEVGQIRCCITAIIPGALFFSWLCHINVCVLVWEFLGWDVPLRILPRYIISTCTLLPVARTVSIINPTFRSILSYKKRSRPPRSLVFPHQADFPTTVKYKSRHRMMTSLFSSSCSFFPLLTFCSVYVRPPVHH